MALPMIIAIALLLPLSLQAQSIDFLRLFSLLRNPNFTLRATYDLNNFDPYPIAEDSEMTDSTSIIRSISLSPDSRYFAFFTHRAFNEAEYEHLRSIYEMKEMYKDRKNEPVIKAWFDRWRDDINRVRAGSQTLFVVEVLGDNRIKVITHQDLKPPTFAMSLGPTTVEFIDDDWLRIGWQGLSKTEFDHHKETRSDFLIGENYDFFNPKTGEWVAFPGTHMLAVDSLNIKALASDLYLVLGPQFANSTPAAFYQFHPSHKETRIISPLHSNRWPGQDYFISRVQKTKYGQYLFEVSVFGKVRKTATQNSWHKRWFELFPSGHLISLPSAAELERRMGSEPVQTITATPALAPAHSPVLSLDRIRELSKLRQIEWIESFSDLKSNADRDQDDGFLPAGQILRASVALLEAGFMQEDLPEDLRRLMDLHARLNQFRLEHRPLFTLRKAKLRGFYLYSELNHKIAKFLPIPSDWEHLQANINQGNMTVENQDSHESISFPLQMLQLRPRPQPHEINCEAALKH